ncbi:MAG: hypothetical protein Q7R30_23270 [Acidobacteriota bacterium]|nr:hypothetical protein [Acidobacteriota bacterium]
MRSVMLVLAVALSGTAALSPVLSAGSKVEGPALSAGSTQEPVINRSAPMTLTGEIVDISCYKQKGVAAGTGAAHLDCAKMCVLEKGAALGILSDGDGLFRIWGTAARDKYLKVQPFIGQTVAITGTEVTLSNNYDVRSFDLQTIKIAKKTP